MRLQAFALAALLASWPDSRAMAQTPQTPPTPPGAATASPATVDDARRHFQRGVDFFKDSSYDAALAEFERAYEIVPNYRILYNLGQVQVERHDYAAAIAKFRAYLQMGGSDIPPERRSNLSKRLDELALRVGQLSVKAEPTGAEILIDDVTVGTAPLSPILVNAGVRRVVVRSPGYLSTSRSLTVVGGETVQLDLVLSTDSELSHEEAAVGVGEKTSHAVANRTVMWIGLAATAALTVGWATFAVLAKQADSDLTNLLNQYPANRARLDDKRSQEKVFAALSDGLAVGAVVGLGFTLYEGLRPATGSSPRAASPPQAELRIGPGNLACLVRF